MYNCSQDTMTKALEFRVEIKYCRNQHKSLKIEHNIISYTVDALEHPVLCFEKVFAVSWIRDWPQLSYTKKSIKAHKMNVEIV